MALLSGKKLEELLLEALGTQFDKSRIKQAAYELSLGNETYLTDSVDKKPEILSDENSTVSINPGQFALLMAKETISVPNDRMGFISIKASEKLKGLINVSGFHVDPGFNGQLLFSVYNAGPSIITLKKGMPYFLIWFIELSESLKPKNAYNKIDNSHQNQEGIATKYLDALKNGFLASPHALQKQIENNQRNVGSIETQTKNYWSNLRWIAGIVLGLLITLNIGVWSNIYNKQEKYIEELKTKEIPESIGTYIDTIDYNRIVREEIKNRLNTIQIIEKDSIEK